MTSKVFNSPAAPLVLLLMAIAAIIVGCVAIVKLYVFLIGKGIDLIMDCDCSSSYNVFTDLATEV